MVTKTIQSSNVKDYQNAIEDLEPYSDFVYGMDSSGYYFLMLYKSYEVQRVSQSAGDVILITGKTVTFNQDPDFPDYVIETGLFRLVAGPGRKLTIGPFKELKQLFVKDFKAFMAQKTAKELQKLEDTFNPKPKQASDDKKDKVCVSCQCGR